MAYKKLKKPDTYTITVKGKKCIITDPNFNQLSLGLSALSSGSGNLDMAGGGKAVFDVCVVECDKEIEESGKLMMSICIKIAEEYLLPLDTTIKKN